MDEGRILRGKIKVKLGVQIYGCVNDFRKNPEKFFSKLVSFGYTQVEPCIAVGISAEALSRSGANPVWQPEEAMGFCKLMRKYDLNVSSCHMFGDALSNIEIVRKLISDCGIEQLVVNCPSDELEITYLKFAEHCCELAYELQKDKTELWIHNNYYEIKEKVNGKSILEAILEQCKGAVGTQIDVGWALYGGEDPLEYLKKVASYLRSIHYKDLKTGYQALPADSIHSCLGEGVLDAKGIHEYALSLNLPEVIDQDKSEDFLEDLKKSANFLSQL